MVFIYVLKLEQGKYYIGKTDNPQFRLENHYNGNGSAWTQKYKPLKVIKLIPDCDNYEENNTTIKYMDKYGTANVRGGSFVKITLDKSTLDVLAQMKNGTKDKCFTCGESGHFAANCLVSKSNEDNDNNSNSDGWETLSEDDEVWVCSNCDKEFTEKSKCKNHSKYCDSKCKKQSIYDDGDSCFRCGRMGHYANNCYALKHIKGYYL